MEGKSTVQQSWDDIMVGATWAQTHQRSLNRLLRSTLSLASSRAIQLSRPRPAAWAAGSKLLCHSFLPPSFPSCHCQTGPAADRQAQSVRPTPSKRGREGGPSLPPPTACLALQSLLRCPMASRDFQECNRHRPRRQCQSDRAAVLGGHNGGTTEREARGRKEMPLDFPSFAARKQGRKFLGKKMSGGFCNVGENKRKWRRVSHTHFGRNE